MTENENPLGGRITLGIIGVVLLGLGAAGIGAAVTSPSSGGVGTYAFSGLLGVGGAATLAAAILNPDSLDIDEDDSLDKAEMRERRDDDEPCGPVCWLSGCVSTGLRGGDTRYGLNSPRAGSLPPGTVSPAMCSTSRIRSAEKHNITGRYTHHCD